MPNPHAYYRGTLTLHHAIPGLERTRAKCSDAKLANDIAARLSRERAALQVELLNDQNIRLTLAELEEDGE